MTGDITEKIRELGGGTLSFVKKELQRLPELLKEGEELRALGSGEIKGKNWLLAVTDVRLMLLYITPCGEEFVESPLSDVTSVFCNMGALFFTAVISIEDQKYTIKKLERIRFKDIAAAFPENIITVKKQNIFIRLAKIVLGLIFAVCIFGWLVDNDIIHLPEKKTEGTHSAMPSPSSSTQSQRESVSQQNILPLKEEADYTVAAMQKMPPHKMSMTIDIFKPVNADVLRATAEDLYNGYNGKRYERVFMLWYLPDMEKGAGAWASTNFEPGLSVRILR